MIRENNTRCSLGREIYYANVTVNAHVKKDFEN